MKKLSESVVSIGRRNSPVDEKVEQEMVVETLGDLTIAKWPATTFFGAKNPETAEVSMYRSGQELGRHDVFVVKFAIREFGKYIEHSLHITGEFWSMRDNHSRIHITRREVDVDADTEKESQVEVVNWLDPSMAVLSDQASKEKKLNLKGKSQEVKS